jgi:hypothetical protein
LLRTASLTEAALAFGIGSIAPSVRAGGDYNLIDECDAVHISQVRSRPRVRVAPTG